MLQTVLTRSAPAKGARLAFSPPHSDTFYAAVADMAERLRHTIIGLIAEERLGYVQRLVAESEIVFCVWPDPSSRGGFGFRLIKGWRHLPAIAASTMPNEMTTSAIPCVGGEQALAAEGVWGDPDIRAAEMEHPKKAKTKVRTARSKPKRAAKQSIICT